VIRLFEICGLIAAAGASLYAPAVAAATAPPAALRTDEGRQIIVMLRLMPDHFRPNASYGGDYADGLTSKARHRLAERIAHRHQLDLLDRGWPMPLLGLDCFVMRVPAGMTVESAMAAVGHDPQVAWSQPMQLYRTQTAVRGRDPLLPVEPAAIAWHLEDLHHIATGRGVKVAVIDSRVETDHPDLAGQFVASQDFVTGRPSGPERHGTAVAGVIAAKADNGIGMAGIAPGARLMALRACWQTGSSLSAPTLCDSLGLAQALQYAILHGARVINLSLAGPPDRLLDRLIEIAEARNISVVAAYDPALPGGGFPASKTGVIAVASETMSRLPPGVYAAPGNDVPTTEPGGKWYLVDGSSFAAAHVSGLIALVREDHAASAHISLAVVQHGAAVDACATLLRAKSCHCLCPSGGSPGSVAR
jgi:hypothetical protein